MTEGESPQLPEYLRDEVTDGGAPPPSEPAPAEVARRSRRSRRSRRLTVMVVTVAVASAVVGSAVTFAVTRTTDETTPTPPTSTSVPASTSSTIDPNPVFRIDEPATIDDWVITVGSFRVVTALRGYPPAAGRRWLVVDARVTNGTGSTRTFSADMIEARTLGDTGESVFVSAMPGEAWQPPPHGTLSARFVFPVAASAKVFTVVVRRPLGSLKQLGSSVEIDLNCC